VIAPHTRSGKIQTIVVERGAKAPSPSGRDAPAPLGVAN
jgi:hypothetical protein